MTTGRVQQIIDHEHQAYELQTEADTHRWEAARLIWEELETGKSQRALAAEIGKSQTHVMYMARTHERKLKFSDGSVPPFNEVYNSPEVRGSTDQGRTSSDHPSPGRPAHGRPDPGRPSEGRNAYGPSPGRPVDDHYPTDRHLTEEERREKVKSYHANKPMSGYGPDEALANWLVNFREFFAYVRTLVDKDEEKKQDLRAKLHEMVEEMFQ